MNFVAPSISGCFGDRFLFCRNLLLTICHLLAPIIFITLKGYTIHVLAKEIVDGVIVGIVALLLSLAFAIASPASDLRNGGESKPHNLRNRSGDGCPSSAH